MNYGSVCSGIESASMAWEEIGWSAAWFSEIEPFPCAVLEYHWPDIPNMGDMTILPDMIRSRLIIAPDVLVGGTPCQAFSIAGLRDGLKDDRGQLTLTYVEVLNAIDEQRPEGKECVAVWENVPGALSSKDNAFGCFLAALVGEDDPLEPAGKKWTNAGYVSGPQRNAAWRILDAQYFGVAQRRRRLFVVTSARDRFDPGEVLFECDGVRRDTPPSREEGERVAPIVTGGAPFNRTGNSRVECEALIVQEPFDLQAFGQYGKGKTSSTLKSRDHKDATDLITVRTAQTSANGKGFDENGPSYTLDGTQGQAVVMPINTQIVTRHKKLGERTGFGVGEPTDPAFTLQSAHSHAVFTGYAVRRLTPKECERLQGFPAGYTQIPWGKKPTEECPDGHRYKALGNSKAVPVIQWIGRRIAGALNA